MGGVSASCSGISFGGPWFGGPFGSHQTGGSTWRGGHCHSCTPPTSDDAYEAKCSVPTGDSLPWAAVAIVTGEVSASEMTLVGVDSTLLDMIRNTSEFPKR